MSNRFRWRALVAALLLLPILVVGGNAAMAKSGKASKNARVEMTGKLTFKRNKFIRDGAHFSPGTVVIRSGGKLTLKNRQPHPHTFSIVSKSDVPKTIGKVDNCGAPGTICDKIFTAHKPDADGNPTVPVVDVGKPGIDQVGDSVILGPKESKTVTVSAPKGTTLSFFCGIHAWMQGVLKVR
jgi:hypothetical protein